MGSRTCSSMVFFFPNVITVIYYFYTIIGSAYSSDWYLRLVVFCVGFLGTPWRHLILFILWFVVSAEGIVGGMYEFSWLHSFLLVSPIQGRTS